MFVVTIIAAEPDLLSIIGSYGDTLRDTESSRAAARVERYTAPVTSITVSADAIGASVRPVPRRCAARLCRLVIATKHTAKHKHLEISQHAIMVAGLAMFDARGGPRDARWKRRRDLTSKLDLTSKTLDNALAQLGRGKRIPISAEAAARSWIA